MIQYIADEAHFKEVIARVPNVKRSLWIGTADIKDLYVGDRPFLGILADLISKGREGKCGSSMPMSRVPTSGRTSTDTPFFSLGWSGRYVRGCISS